MGVEGKHWNARSPVVQLRSAIGDPEARSASDTVTGWKGYNWGLLIAVADTGGVGGVRSNPPKFSNPHGKIHVEN